MHHTKVFGLYIMAVKLSNRAFDRLCDGKGSLQEYWYRAGQVDVWYARHTDAYYAMLREEEGL